MRPQVDIVYDDPKVHCIDVSDTTGAWAIRIRPKAGGGATFDCNDLPVFLTREDVAALSSALDRLAR